MYKLYNQRKGTQIVLFGMVALLVGLGVAASIDVITTGENVLIGIFGCVFFLGLAFIFFKITLAISHPYSEIDALRVSNPELVKDYEADFQTAENVLNAFWLGQRYIFFRAFKFTVASYHDIKSLRLYKHYSSKSVSYEMEAMINGSKIQVNISYYGNSKKDVVAAVERLSALSGAPFTNEL